VQFNLDLNTVHEVTPYSEVYGVHPRRLRFRSAGSVKLLAEADTDKDFSDDDEDEDLWKMGYRNRRCPSPLPPWSCWSLLAVLCFLLRAFGAQALIEALFAVSGKSLTVAASGSQGLLSFFVVPNFVAAT